MHKIKPHFRREIRNTHNVVQVTSKAATRGEVSVWVKKAAFVVVWVGLGILMTRYLRPKYNRTCIDSVKDGCGRLLGRVNPSTHQHKRLIMPNHPLHLLLAGNVGPLVYISICTCCMSS